LPGWFLFFLSLETVFGTRKSEHKWHRLTNMGVFRSLKLNSFHKLIFLKWAVNSIWLVVSFPQANEIAENFFSSR